MQDLKILVIGDSCSDVFIYGNVKRINPEAPTPVFTPVEKKTYYGMAGNVYENLKSLGLNNTEIISNYERLSKKRIVDIKSNYILLRIDKEPKIKPLKTNFETFAKYDAVVISDYNKGFLDEDTIQRIIMFSKISFIDTKKPFGKWITNADLIKINETEYNNPLHDPHVLKSIQNKLIITKGSKGCVYNRVKYKTDKVDINDVVGAGDSFFAGFVYSYMENKDIIKAIEFANKCGSYAVSQKGISTLNKIKPNK